MIDDTRPKALPAGSLEVKSVGPGAYARIPELNALGVMRGDYLDAGVELQWSQLDSALL